MQNKLRTDLEKAHKILYMEGLAEDTARGHITLRSEDDRVYIKPWGIGFEEVTAENLLCVDMEGKLLKGKGKVHSEIPLHLEIFRRRKEIVSAVHVHPLHTVLFSSVFKGRMRIVGQNGMHFGGEIPFYESEDLIRSEEQGIEVARLMGDKLYVLMRNHGITTAGRSLAEAIILAIDFEKAAKEHLLASLLGEGTEVSLQNAKKMTDKLFIPEQYQMMWDFYCRKLERKMKASI